MKSVNRGNAGTGAVVPDSGAVPAVHGDGAGDQLYQGHRLRLGYGGLGGALEDAVPGGPVAYVRTVFAVYEVACVTQPRLFLRCYERRI